MKKLLLMIVAVALVGAFSCTKDNVGQDTTGAEAGIPGMGDRVAEDLEIGENFVLPEGVRIEGGIQGIAPMHANLKSGSDTEVDEVYGLGGQFITLVMKFVNENPDATEILFRPGLIFEIVEQAGYSISEFQRGMVLTQMLVNIDGSSEKTVALNLFCFNEGKSGSAFSVEYKAVGQTENTLLLDLLFYVNNENYNWLGDANDVLLGTLSMGVLTNEQAGTLIENIQALIWWVTDNTHAEALTKEQIKSKIEEVLGQHTS